MSIDQTDVIDAIGIVSATGEVLLAITDHLAWYDEEGHMTLLQEKLNSYLRFIESGEMHEEYPRSVGREVCIEVIGKYDLSPGGEVFMRNVALIIEGAGFRFRFRKSDGK